MKKNQPPIRTCITLNVSQEFKDTLQEVADENRRSLSGQIILMVEKYLANKGK